MKIIASQIGYDLGKEKKVFLCDAYKDYSIVIVNVITKNTEYTDKAKLWGNKWNHTWYFVDFTILDKPGLYELQVLDDETNEAIDRVSIKIGDRLLWHSTWYDVSLGQLEVRKATAYEIGFGWRDCGSELQEVSSHIIMLDALMDLLELGETSEIDTSHIYEQMITGADYIVNCQENNGEFVHERKQNKNISTGNCINAVYVLARLSRKLRDKYALKAEGYLSSAKKGYIFIKTNGPLVYDFVDERYTFTHGAPEGMLTPPKEYMTRDIMAKIDAAIELYKATLDMDYYTDACDAADEVVERQIKKDNAEYGLYGHFRTYKSFVISEKANQHCGAWDIPYKSYNQGAHKPYWVIPLIRLAEICKEQNKKERYLLCVEKFVKGFFIPAYHQSPFKILPAGVYDKQGLLFFGCWYHGHTKIYGYAAKLACQFKALFPEYSKVLDDIATSNLQWIAGLNILGKSLIVGIGDKAFSDWNNLKGTIINGFDSSRQFTIEKPLKETDMPNYVDDEGGIHHCAGYLAGITEYVK